MFKKYKVDFLLGFLAIVPTSISLAYDFSVANEYYWFQRSGSLMVLFGVMLDFYQNQHTELEQSSSVTIGGQAAITGTTLSKTRKYIQVFSIGLAIVGTFIWGYGDVPFK